METASKFITAIAIAIFLLVLSALLVSFIYSEKERKRKLAAQATIMEFYAKNPSGIKPPVNEGIPAGGPAIIPGGDQKKPGDVFSPFTAGPAFGS